MARADVFIDQMEEGLPKRSSNTLSDAIAIASPSGSMSNRAREAARKKLYTDLFGKEGIGPRLPQQPTEVENLLRKAKELRELASRGMKPRAYNKEADRLEAEAKNLMKKS